MNYLKTEPRDSPEPAPGLDEWDRMMATLIDVRFGHGQSDAAAFIAKMAREKSESACVAAHARGLREGLEARDRLAIAAHALLRGCEDADAAEELPSEVDGDLMFGVRTALRGMGYPKCVACDGAGGDEQAETVCQACRGLGNILPAATVEAYDALLAEAKGESDAAARK